MRRNRPEQAYQQLAIRLQRPGHVQHRGNLGSTRAEHFYRILSIFLSIFQYISSLCHCLISLILLGRHQLSVINVINNFGGAPFLTITYDPRGLGIRDSQLTIWCTDGQSCSGSAASGLGPRKSKVNKRPMKINEDLQQRAMMDTDGSCRDSKWFKLLDLLGDLWTASAVCFQSSCADEAHTLDSQNLSMIAAASVWCMWQRKSCRSTAVQAWDFAEVKKSRVGLKWIKFELMQNKSPTKWQVAEGLDAQHDLVMWRIVL